jgi:hypothetical protein
MGKDWSAERRLIAGVRVQCFLNDTRNPYIAQSSRLLLLLRVPAHQLERRHCETLSLHTTAQLHLLALHRKGDTFARALATTEIYLNLSPEDVIWSFIVSGKCCLVTATL